MGEYMGYAPTGKHFEVRSLQIGRFENGKIKERWGSTDILGILGQLGLLRGNERSTARSSSSSR
jgi:predicted ester cyclase